MRFTVNRVALELALVVLATLLQLATAPPPPPQRPRQSAPPAPPRKVYHIDLGGDPSMPYVGQIQIGTPPQTFRVLYDTGTAHIWVAASDCKRTGGGGGGAAGGWTPVQKYERARSTTYQAHNAMPRCYKNTELGLKLHASVCEETVQLADTRNTSRLLPVPNQPFSLINQMSLGTGASDQWQAAEQQQQQLLQMPFDGFVGLSLPGGEGDYTATLLHNFHLNEALEEPVFTLYAGAMPKGAAGNSSAPAKPRTSELVLGQIDKLKFVPPLVWAPVTRHPFWEIRVHAIRLLKQAQQANKKPSVAAAVCSHGCEAEVRTGTRHIMGPAAEVETLNKALGFARATQGDRNLFVAPRACAQHLASLTGAGDLTLTLQVNTTAPALELKLDTLMFDGGPRGESCVSVLRVGRPSKWTLGSLFVTNFYTVFDYGAKRVGFARPVRPRSLRD